MILLLCKEIKFYYWLGCHRIIKVVDLRISNYNSNESQQNKSYDVNNEQHRKRSIFGSISIEWKLVRTPFQHAHLLGGY